MATKKVLLKVAPTTGDPVKGKQEETTTYSSSKPQIDLDFDIRDRLSELVGKGNALKPDDKVAIYRNLVSSLGEQKAQKVMNHAFIFNQRPDVQALPVEDKLRTFYTMGSNDPDVNGLISRSKSLGYGTVSGFRSSSSDLNQSMQRPMPAASTAGINPDVQKRIMLKISK